MTSQALVARNVPRAGKTTAYVATSAGLLYAVTPAGRILWQVRLGRISHPCTQLDGYGVTGTPAVDRSTRAIYAVDGTGRLHSLDLATGTERAGWPVDLYSDFRSELVWGALTIVGGSVYAGTGSYCDAPMVGKVLRVQLRSRELSSWITVAASRGGGGGVWGWGGLAYSSKRRSLLAVTGNAFRGGSNDGSRFREWAPYGEHLVELSPSLKLRSANHPRGISSSRDLDFVGSPVLVSRPGCPELAVALNKNGRLYAWRSSRIAAGVRWSLRVAPGSARDPLITQAAYSGRLHSLYVVSTRQVVRVAVTAGCRGRIAWTHRYPRSVNSAPTVAGKRIWLVHWRKRATLLALDGRTGAVRFRTRLDKDWYLAAPTVYGGRIYLPSFSGRLRVLG